MNWDSAISAETLQKLATYDTPTICNVIELFEIRPKSAGYMDGRIRAAYDGLPPMVGFASTASVRASIPNTTGDIYESIEAQMRSIQQLPGPSVVVFQDLDEPAVGATFGEVLCSSYRAFGSVGLVSSGAGRDFEQIRELDYPVFTRSKICSHAYCHLVEIGQKIFVGGLAICTGDLLHGDTNGITNIPLEIAAELAEAADEYIAAEQIVLDYLEESGDKDVNKLVECRKAMGDAIAVLRNRVSRKTNS